jgi:hypothetical protein
MNDKKDKQTNEKQQAELKTCLNCVHLGDDAHCERIECWDYSGWTAARDV